MKACNGVAAGKVAVFLTALSGAFGSVACGKTDDGTSTRGPGESAGGTAGQSAGGAQNANAGGTVGLATGGGLGIGGDLGRDAGHVPDVPTVHWEDAGPPPAIACGADAGDAEATPACAPPPSRCMNGEDLLYYTDGVCIAGRCAWTPAATKCRLRCSGGACRDNLTR